MSVFHPVDVAEVHSTVTLAWLVKVFVLDHLSDGGVFKDPRGDQYPFEMPVIATAMERKPVTFWRRHNVVLMFVKFELKSVKMCEVGECKLSRVLTEQEQSGEVKNIMFERV